MRFTNGNILSDDEILDVLILIEAGSYQSAISYVRGYFGNLKMAGEYVKFLAKEHLNKDIFKFLDETATQRDILNLNTTLYDTK
jgi:hypothetical protein